MTLSNLSAETLATIVNGYWLEDNLPDFPLQNTLIDSRKMAENMLFIALKGAHHDGHDFLTSLSGENQQAALVSQPNKQARLPQLCVADVEAGFQALATHIAHHSPAKRLAITGSVGKTGTKDMIAAMLGEHGITHATTGNLNNHLGLPLTLTNMPDNAQYLVAEMGMNHAGEIARLSEICKPNIAIITRISNAHAGQFESLSEIAEAKAEIFTAADAFATAILPRDDEFYGQLAGSARLSGIAQVISFGTHIDSTIRLESQSRQGHHLHITASFPDREQAGQRKHVTYAFGMRSRHNVMNSLCALATGYALKLDIASLLPAFAKMQETAGRGRLHHLQFGQQKCALIDDSYNASPASVLAAFDDIADYDAKHKVAILTDMLELGPQAEGEHLALVPSLIAAGFQKVITAGPLMAQCASHLSEQIKTQSFADDAQLLADLGDQPEKMIGHADLVLVKGSHGSGAHHIARYLIDRFEIQQNGPTTPEGGTCHAA